MISKMERRSLNVFFISAVFLILLPPEGFSKECYTCSSTKSWEDCLENSQFFECEAMYPEMPAADIVCLSVVRSKLRTWNQQIVHYAKFCSPKEMCDEARCQREMIPRKEYNITKAGRCDIECCSEDKCNDGKLTVLNLAELAGDRAEDPKTRPKTLWSKTKTHWSKTKTHWSKTKTHWSKTKTHRSKTKTHWSVERRLSARQT